MIDGTNDEISATINGVGPATVSIAHGTYYWLNDGTAADFGLALVTALATHPAGLPVTGVLTSAGKLTLTCAQAWAIHWTALPANPLAAKWCGCTTSADFTGLAGVPSTSPYQVGLIWNPGVRFADDEGNQYEAQISQVRALDGTPATWQWSDEYVFRTILLSLVPIEKILEQDAAQSESFQEFHRYIRTGGVFRWTPDIATPATHSAWVLRERADKERWPVARIESLSRYYLVTLRMQASMGT